MQYYRWLEDKSLVYNDTNNISKQFNLEGNNWELKIIDWDYWKSKKWTNCFRPKKWWKHYLIEENWWWAHRKSYWRSFDSNLDGILYYKRSSSNGGGTWYDYAIVKKDYKRKVSLDDI